MSTSAGIPDFRSPETGKCPRTSLEAEHKLTCDLHAAGCMVDENRIICEWDEGVS